MKLPSGKYIDKTFWGLFITLGIIAFIALFSASSTLVYERDSIIGPVGKQLAFLILGFALAFIMQFAGSWMIRWGGYKLLICADVMVWSLLLPKTLNPFKVVRNEAARWINLFGIEFEPSEIAKLALIIVVADLLSKIKTEEDKRKYFLLTLIYTIITILPIMTSNMSTAILLGVIVFIMWILARIPAKYTWGTAGIVVATGAVIFSLVTFIVIPNKIKLPDPFGRLNMQVQRVLDKFNENEDNNTFVLTNKNYQPSLAKVAVARGGATPFGVFPGNSQERDYLPQAFADYIFAIIVEETGIIGAIGLIILYLAILFRACWTSSRFNDYPAMLMVMGLALMITCQALVSMMVAVGIGPVTGQPLPLISRGGTSVIITSIYFGVMLCVSREQAERQSQQLSVQNDSEEDVPDIEEDI